MKLNDIDINSLSDTDLKRICIKYQIIQTSEIHSITRDRLLRETKTYLKYKMETYKQRKRSMSDPNIRSVSTNPSSSGRRNSVHSISQEQQQEQRKQPPSRLEMNGPVADIDDIINNMNLQPNNIPDLDNISIMSGDSNTSKGITLNL